MAIRFDVEDGALLVRPSDLVHREFRALYEADKSKSKEKATQHLLFVYCFCDMESDYFENDDAEKLQNCKDNCYQDPHYEWDAKTRPLIEAAIAKYELLNENAPKRGLASIQKKIDQFRRILDATEPSLEEQVIFENGKKVKEIKPNYEAIADVVKAIDSFEVAYEKMEARIAKVPEGRKNRAGASESLLESGRLGPKPNKAD